MSMQKLIDELKIQREADIETGLITTQWWGTMAEAVSATLAWTDGDTDKKAVADMLATLVEKPFKLDTGDKSMPSAYRSAKSVVCSAKEYGISLLREDGTPKGKSEVEKEIKEARADKSVDDKIEGLAATISKLLDKGEHTEASAEVLRNLYNKAI